MGVWGISKPYPYCTRVSCTHLKSVVSPTAELHLAALVVEREPSDIDFARRLEDARWDVHAGAIVPDYHVRWVRSVKSLVGTAMKRLINIQSGISAAL